MNNIFVSRLEEGILKILANSGNPLHSGLDPAYDNDTTHREAKAACSDTLSNLKLTLTKSKLRTYQLDCRVPIIQGEEIGNSYQHPSPESVEENILTLSDKKLVKSYRSQHGTRIVLTREGAEYLGDTQLAQMLAPFSSTRLPPRRTSLGVSP